MEVSETEVMPPEQILYDINQFRGVMWDKIASFREIVAAQSNSIIHKVGTPQSEEMKDMFPLKQTLEGGLYTRELFMPANQVVVSMIHRQQHPSFLLKGKVSYLTDAGEVKTITGPHIIHTQIGTQRVIFVHEDTQWCCVYKTDAKTFEEAEADVYADNYKELPQKVINKIKTICQE
jgi:hypothetical protein|tara:strand:- start:539 stop:1069 length:531 start_codon:yes stop_codon:yes gene_type:complete